MAAPIATGTGKEAVILLRVPYIASMRLMLSVFLLAIGLLTAQPTPSASARYQAQNAVPDSAAILENLARETAPLDVDRAGEHLYRVFPCAADFLLVAGGNSTSISLITTDSQSTLPVSTTALETSQIREDVGDGYSSGIHLAPPCDAGMHPLSFLEKFVAAKTTARALSADGS